MVRLIFYCRTRLQIFPRVISFCIYVLTYFVYKRDIMLTSRKLAIRHESCGNFAKADSMKFYLMFVS